MEHRKDPSMTIARESARGAAKKAQPRFIDVTDLKVYPPSDKTGRKHFNFLPKGSGNAKGGLYADD